MKGLPKVLNTKADYEYVLKNFNKADVLPFFQELLDTAKDWFYVGEVTNVEKGITDDTHKVISDKGYDDETEKYYQYELKENPQCKLLQLGFTVKEVEGIINER